MILNLMVTMPAYRMQVHLYQIQSFSKLSTLCAQSEAMAVERARAIIEQAGRSTLEAALRAGASKRDAQALASTSVKEALVKARTADPDFVAFHYSALIPTDTCDLAYNRNWALGAALRGDPIHDEEDPEKIVGFNPVDWLLMVDADTAQRRPGYALRMIADAHKMGAPVIAAPVMRRDGLLNVLGFDGDTPLNRKQLGTDICEVRRIGTAFMAVNVAWIRDHWPLATEDGVNPDPWFLFEQRIKNGMPHNLSEDFWFCEGVRKHGGKVYCDPRFMPFHSDAPEVERNAEP